MPVVWIAALALLALLGTSAPPSFADELRFPAQLTDVDGAVLDIAALAAGRPLVVVTLKSATCPVCRTQLERILRKLPEIQSCGVRFVVLAPGPRDALAAVRDATDFPYPFVVDEDFALGDRLGLRLSETELVPAILLVEPDLRVGWMQRGRSARYYGDAALVEEINCGNWI